jgi:spermidine synthase
VLWLRLLALSVGHTAAAVGILLAAFMGGLAFGAWGAGRTAGTMAPARALRTYAVLEVGIATCALLLPLVLASARPALVWAYAGQGGRLFDVTMALLALLLLAVPAAAMGATYPLAVRWIQRPGTLYAANTAGAAIGAALTGFVLLPALGMFGTTLVGVALNVVAAVGALALARRSFGGPDKARPTYGLARPANPEGAPYMRSSVWLALVAAAVAGLVSLLLQVTWTRILAMVLGPTTYAFSAMLVAVIAGIAIGSAIVAIWAPRGVVTLCGTALVSAAAAALAAAFVVDRAPLMMAAAVTRPDVTFGAVFLRQVLLVVALQMPMTIALGAVFPLTLAMTRGDAEGMPRRVSVLYAMNTCGAIAGALLGSFVLVPAAGLQGAIRIGAGLLLLTGWLVVRLGAGQRRRGSLVFAAVAASVALAALLMPPWNPARLANGGYRYAAALAAGDIETGLEAGQLVYYREGAAGTVSVRQVPGALSLAIDGKVDASNAGDMLTQKLLAHLPMLLHANPRRVCIIGLGSGVTLGAALTHPVARADMVEISPQVVEASRFFTRENHAALDDPRARLIVGDGRAHLHLSEEQYDVIISEPSNPWMAGVATLFTREFFVTARERLAPGGLLTQWAHTYSISQEDLQSIVATFLSVFPDGTAWLVANSDLLLIGGRGPIPALEAGIAQAWTRPGVARDLAEIDVRNPLSVLSLYVAGGEALTRFAGDAEIQTDDRLQLEYTAPRAVYGRFQQANVENLLAMAASAPRPPAIARAVAAATAADVRDRGLMQLRANAPGLAFLDLREAVRQVPDDLVALNGFVRAASRSGQLREAEQVLEAAGALVQLSIVQNALGRSDEAAESARQAVLASPSRPAALMQLASIYADRGSDEALEKLLAVAEQATTERTVHLYIRARLAYLRGDFAQVVQIGQQLAALTPADVTVFNLLASAHAALQQYDRARVALETSRRLAPTDPGTFVNLGTVALRAGDADAAVQHFSDALFLSPTLRPALDGLADALERQGRAGRAAEIRARSR